MRYNIYFLLYMIAVMLFLCGCTNVEPQFVAIQENESESSASDESGNESSREVEENTTEVLTCNEDDTLKIYVYVCGCVQNPGVYLLPEGARVYDALNMAGGVTANGNGEALEQAKSVSDGDTIYVPDIQEEITARSVTGLAETEVSDGRININTATIQELMTLPGIGESKATMIYEYRNENGLFSKIEDLMEIPGIKEGVYNKIKNQIKV